MPLTSRAGQSGAAGDRAGTRRMLGSEPWASAIVICLVCHTIWYLHGIIEPLFLNKDVAGIVYNARLIPDGLLPYANSAELKPPGAFVLISAIVPLGGLRAVWVAAVFWAAATSIATGLFASRIWGAAWGPRVAILHVAASPLSALIDINYTFWMTLPFVGAATAAAWAVGAERSRARRLWSTAGALVAFAVLIKPSACPLVIVVGAALAVDSGPRRMRRFGEALLALCAGGFVAALAVFAPFLVQGRVAALVDGFRATRTFGSEYVSVVGHDPRSVAFAVVEGFRCVQHYLALLLPLAAVGSIPLFRDDAPRPWKNVLLCVAFALASLVGVASTLRFYSHDNAQLWPVLAVVTLNPRSLTGRAVAWLAEAPRPRLLPSLGRLAPLWLGLAVTIPFLPGVWGLRTYFADKDRFVERTCETFGPFLSADDAVLAWGWDAWGVYEHCRHRAPGRHYKELGIVTTVNTNTCNHGYGPIALRGPAVRKDYLDGLRHNPPGLVVWSEYFKIMGGDPLDQWSELREFLETRYRVVEHGLGFVAYLRRDLADRHPLVAFNAAAVAPEIVPPPPSTCAR